MQKGKIVAWGGLTNRWEKKRSKKQRRKGKMYPPECRVIKNKRTDKKVFLSGQCKEIEENNRMGKTRDLFKKIRDTKGTFALRTPWTVSQFSSVAQLCLILCDPIDCSTPGLPVHNQHPEFNQTQVHWVGDTSNHLIHFCPLLLLPPIPPSIRVFSNESDLHIRGTKYWSFSFNISPSNEQSGLISFRMDWLDLAVQGTLKTLLQHHSSKASILWCSAFFIV